MKKIVVYIVLFLSIATFAQGSHLIDEEYSQKTMTLIMDSSSFIDTEELPKIFLELNENETFHPLNLAIAFYPQKHVEESVRSILSKFEINGILQSEYASEHINKRYAVSCKIDVSITLPRNEIGGGTFEGRAFIHYIDVDSCNKLNDHASQNWKYLGMEDYLRKTSVFNKN
ncbi:MAG TPA: hypothetical protein PKC21_00280 [Oligoflexia bacterium]|nr:hypothetical protein [Oligoflexia bacterium]HMR23763.1 hypothetical protein [Oligoflexia bacterium]